MPTQADFFGPAGGFDSNDYMLCMEGTLGPTDTPQRLKSHALTSPNQETRDALRITTTDLRDGRIVLVTETKRPSEVTLLTYTVGYPQKAIWSPAMAAADRPGGCVKNFYRRYLCSGDRQFDHWFEMPQGVLSPSIYTEDLISNGEDRNAISKTSELSIPYETIGWNLIGSIVNTRASKKINGFSFSTINCPGCDFTPGSYALIVGGDGSAAPTVLVTDNRFATTTSKTVGVSTDMATDSHSTGDTYVIATVTGATYAAATAGKLFVSTDRLATAPVQVAGMTDALRKVVGYESNVFAVGKDSSGNAVLWVSGNGGQTWTKNTSSTLPTGSALLDASWDRETSTLYMVGEDGVVLRGVFTAGVLQISSLTSIVNDTGVDFQACVVLGKNNVLIGGTTGHAWETRDGGRSWVSVPISGTTAITAMDGNQGRAMVGAGTNLYIRDHLTDNVFRAKPLDFGSLSGIVASVTMAADNFNLFAVTTLAGETAIFKAPYPGA